MHTLLNALLHAVRGALHNEVLSGGAALGVVGVLFATLRSLPRRIVSLILRQFILTVDFQSQDESFYWLTLWLDHQPYARRTRRLSASSRWFDDEEGRRLLLAPAPGMHWFFYQGRLLWLSYDRKEMQSGDVALGVYETIQLRLLGRKQTVIRSLVEDARKLAMRDEGKIAVYVNSTGGWKKMSSFVPRPLDTVFLPEGEKESLVSDVQEFLGARDWYAERGIPWRRGYLLHGRPGTGKTSIISALSGHIGFNLYVLALTSTSLSDESLLSLLLDVPQRSAVLLEDIDAVVRQRTVGPAEGKEPRGPTFSGLLNALDGVASRQGIMVFLTTNHPEVLDPALTRPGRVDRVLEFQDAGPRQIEAMVRHFYQEREDLEGLLPTFASRAHTLGRSMAEVQSLLLQNKDDPHAAFATLLHVEEEAA